jgi:hypothetical protein
MIISGLYIYPIKSCRGIALKWAEVTARGLAGDREMMVVDRRGKFITQRQFPQLATVQVNLVGDRLTLSTATLPPINVPSTLNGEERVVEVWNDSCRAIDQGEEIAQWFSELLHTSDCRLVRQSPHHPRRIAARYRQSEGDRVSFADGFPILLIQSASLDELNRQLAPYAPLPMARFRPNVIVEGDRPFAEDDWFEITLGALPMTAVKACTRCVITTTDQTTGDRDGSGEPLVTLGKFRQFQKGKIIFGENVIPKETGWLGVGDRVVVHSLKSIEQRHYLLS